MSKRNTHKKSRAGCSSCKRRHVKCDERGPPCANCRVRNLECDFERASDPATTPGRSPSDEEVNTSQGPHRRELELLHQWTCETYYSFVFQEGDVSTWQVAVPRAALQHDYLLYAMFAISSLHLSITGVSSESESYRLSALQYQNRAIAAFQAERHRGSSENFTTVFAFSVINIVLAMALPSSQVQDSGSSMLDNLNTVFEMLKGTVSIFTSGRPSLAVGAFADWVSRPHQLQHENIDPETQTAFTRLRSFRDEDYALYSASMNGIVYWYDSMTDAIDNLEHCFKLQGDKGQIISFTWLAGLQLGFVEAVGRRDPLALLVIMHWAILFNELSRDKWWARSAGKALVAETTVLLRESRPPWLPAISWVHYQVGLPPPLV